MAFKFTEHLGDGQYDTYEVSEKDLRITLAESLTHLDDAPTYDEATGFVSAMGIEKVIEELKQFEIEAEPLA